MACEGRSQRSFACQSTAILMLATLQLQMVLGTDSDSTPSEEFPKPRLQSKAHAMMQTQTMLHTITAPVGAHPRRTEMEDTLKIDMPSPRIPDPFFGLQDAFDKENVVETSLIRSASAPAVIGEASAEWLSWFWLICIDALMGGFGAASFLYLRFYLSCRPTLRAPARESKKPKLSDEEKVPASASAAPTTLQPDACDDWGCTKLHIMAAAGDWQNMKEFLLEQHVDIDAREAWEETPLHLAARAGHVEVCKCLLGHGADINAMGLGGETPLVVAAKNGQEAVCQLLLLHGAGCGGLRDDELPDLLMKMIVARMLPQED